MYSFFVSEYISKYSRFDVVFFFYYIIILFYYLFVKYFVDKVGIDYIYKFIKLLFKVMVVLGFIQLAFGGVYFNTQARLPAVNIFFWNENEFSAVLGGCILLFYLGEKGKIKFLWIAAASYLILHNGARLVLLSIILFFLTEILLKIPIFKKGYIGFGILFGVVILVFLGIKDVELGPGLSLQEVLLYPLNQIANLEPVYNVGSINNRLNAVIYGVIELKRSYFLGIGPGNSIPMMVENIVPGTEKFTAYSMHNFIFQIITELGILGMTYLIWLTFVVIKAIKSNDVFPLGTKVVFYISLCLCITLLSGPHSNYFFQFIFFYSIFFFRDYEEKGHIKVEKKIAVY
ncbi:O-antigen ligase family protein [Echinicola shivajiensis]|uniref:O-antigen ligase family protein n=1 Tax=Echinicola shivajiensis TaxID=1035916 RepID=UPI001BFC32EF|nr:O-antigen ligase family protein [Echinicola shivajiensis]